MDRKIHNRKTTFIEPKSKHEEYYRVLQCLDDGYFYNNIQCFKLSRTLVDHSVMQI